MVMLLALLADTGTHPVDRRLLRMTALYEQVCLNAFPDDKAVEALMSAQHARSLTPDEVKITMRDDPAEGWALSEDGNPTVWIEFPPFHACSVRWNTPDLGDFSQYRTAAAKYEARIGGFRPADPFNADDGAIHIHAVGEQRGLTKGGTETLFIIDQHITDPERRAAGQTGYVLRFVHQFAPPRPASPK